MSKLGCISLGSAITHICCCWLQLLVLVVFYMRYSHSKTIYQGKFILLFTFFNRFSKCMELSYLMLIAHSIKIFHSQEICSDKLNITMCPLCDKLCDYWDLRNSCMHIKMTYLFDNKATVFFAVFMSFWGEYFLLTTCFVRICADNFSFDCFHFIQLLCFWNSGSDIRRK